MNAPSNNVPSRIRNEADIARLAISRDALAKTIERVTNMIDLETQSLKNYRSIDLVGFNHQKSHALLELTRAMRAIPDDALDADILNGLGTLRERLQNNLDTLTIHLKAVKQLSALIARAIEDDNSDGTYSASIHRAGRAP
ncbi:MAG TPA: hypothetical protein VL492_04760 [Methylovirgula sp.]|jgi:hypothetical protein|nr:hypothetical protein [Methylovirgula sp.]